MTSPKRAEALEDSFNGVRWLCRGVFLVLAGASTSGLLLGVSSSGSAVSPGLELVVVRYKLIPTNLPTSADSCLELVVDMLQSMAHTCTPFSAT